MITFPMYVSLSHFFIKTSERELEDIYKKLLELDSSVVDLIKLDFYKGLSLEELIEIVESFSDTISEKLMEEKYAPTNRFKNSK